MAGSCIVPNALAGSLPKDFFVIAALLPGWVDLDIDGIGSGHLSVDAMGAVRCEEALTLARDFTATFAGIAINHLLAFIAQHRSGGDHCCGGRFVSFRENPIYGDFGARRGGFMTAFARQIAGSG